MNFLDAAYEILKKAGKPLRYTEITTLARTANLLDTKGHTPEASMGSRLYIDVKRPDSRFRLISRGVFALAETPPSDIKERIDEINQKTRAELHKRLFQMPHTRFELLIGELLLALGFEEETIQVTKKSGDNGVDVRGVLNAAGITQINAAVQAKRWQQNVQSPTVQALRGSLTVHEQGIIITTSKFSKGAIEEAQASGKLPISLIDGGKLVDLLIQYEIGVSSERYTVNSLDEEWWGDVVKDPAREEKLPPLLPVIKVQYPCPIRLIVGGQIREGEMLDENGRILYDTVEYKSPSGAAMVATGWKSANGWAVWRFQHPTMGSWHAIDELRQK